MTVLSGQSIRSYCAGIDKPMLYPFYERGVQNGMSYGLSVAGYDIRVAEDITLQPGQFVLASSIEHFNMPNDVIAFVHDKSTWARRGLAVQNTVIEPGWCGFLTMELTFHKQQTPWWKLWEPVVQPLRLRAGDPIAQIVFHKVDAVVERPYSGKYQNQGSGPQDARREGVQDESEANADNFERATFWHPHGML